MSAYYYEPIKQEQTTKTYTEINDVLLSKHFSYTDMPVMQT